MNILLDTHILLWSAADKLPVKAIPYIEDTANVLMFSSASIWEIAIKNGLNRLDFVIDNSLFYRGLLRAGYKELPITGNHALCVESLPLLHKDPFDRILLAQASFEKIPFLTADECLANYSDSVIFVG